MRRKRKKNWGRRLRILSILAILIFFASRLTLKYPIGYAYYINKYSNEYDLDPCLVASVINVESKFDNYAKSPKEARGLMQISPGTGQWASEVLGIEDYEEGLLYDPETNIRIGSWYLNNLNNEFSGDIDLVLAAYNAGSGNVKKWLLNPEYSTDGRTLDKIPFKETEDYLERVRKSQEVYSTIYKSKILNAEEDSKNYVSFLHKVKKKLNI